MNELLAKLRKQVKLQSEKLGRLPTTEELAQCMQTTPEKVRKVLDVSKGLISLDAVSGTGFDTTIGETLSDEEQPTPVDTVAAKFLHRDVIEALNYLNPLERSVLLMRFGFGNEGPKSLAECAMVLGVSRERARQVEARAMKKLRHNSQLTGLKEYLN
jgi:RNA polymerase primary sigma factor